METLLQIQQKTLYNLKQIVEYAEENNLTNTQEFLNFLDEINKKGKLNEGDTLIFSTFGSGFTSGACIIKW